MKRFVYTFMAREVATHNGTRPGPFSRPVEVVALGDTHEEAHETALAMLPKPHPEFLWSLELARVLEEVPESDY